LEQKKKEPAAVQGDTLWQSYCTNGEKGDLNSHLSVKVERVKCNKSWDENIFSQILDLGKHIDFVKISNFFRKNDSFY